MYTSYIGKKFLQLYNDREGTDLTAESFFEEIFFDIFFNDPKHLMHVHGSSFFQKVSPKNLNKGETPEEFRLRRFQTDVRKGKISGSTFVGYAAETEEATTSGQVSTLSINIQQEEMYASWIGQSLAIGVNGGYVMLIGQPEVILTIFEGWRLYRQYLQETPNVKDKQIETWNGHWINHAFSAKYNPDDPWENYRPETNEVQGKVAIPTQPWASVVFSLARKFPNQEATAYCYNLSQTNTTLGFINLQLPKVRKMHQLRNEIFIRTSETVLGEEQINKLQTHFLFNEACKLGVIGLKALEPKDLRKYMPKGTFLYAGGKDFKFQNQESYFNYQLYKLWIIAMLNKTELLELAAKVAGALVEYETPKIDKEENRGKTTASRLTVETLESKSLKDFIAKVTELLKKMPEKAETFKAVVQETLALPSDSFPLFITLIRFEYQYLKSQPNVSQTKLF